MTKPKHLEDLDSSIEEMEAKFGGSKTEGEDSKDTSTKDEEEVVEQDTEEEELDDLPSETNLDDDDEDSQDSEDAEDDDASEELEVQDTDKPPKQRRDWKKSYKSLRSHHDALVYDLRQELANTKTTLIELNKKNRALAIKLEELSSKQDDEYSAEDIDLIGEDAIKAFKKMQDKAVKPLKDQLEEERNLRLKQEEESVKTMQEQNKRKFIERFSRIVPNYVDIDKDPKFLAYMKGADEVSGYDRTTLFKRAVQNGDVARAAGFYTEYLRKNQKPDNLRKKITPTGNSNSMDQVRSNPKGKEILTTAYINQ
jgi:hypothetical protein